MGMMGRRDFGVGLVALGALLDGEAGAQVGKDNKPAESELKQLSSGTFTPGPGYGSLPKRVSHRYVMGMLKAGNIRLEMHETIQEPGAEHEPVDTHKHNEIWCVQRGVASLYINGTEHTMHAGDVGLVCAGDEHWIKNAGSTELAYFVVTLGPPEVGQGLGATG